MDDRHLTFIIVPHGELETRTFQISYRRLKLLLVAAAALVLVVCVFLALWFPALTQAARVPGLERELAELERERARVAELAQTLADVEQQYEQVRQMLGADASVSGEAPVLPPLRRAGAGTGAGASVAADLAPAVLTTWPVPGRAGSAGSSSTRDDLALSIAVPPDTKVMAAGAGTVVAAGDDAALGRHVILDHGSGVQTLYGHAARVYVKRGESVAAGQVIALSGASGRATAPHLRFEVRKDGKPVDPLAHLRLPQSP